MLVNGYSIGQWQRCKRPWIIGRTHTISKWRPQSLLSACLRLAIFEISNGKDPDRAALEATNSFMAAAKNPGLDLYGVDTYTLASDYVATIKNIIEYLSRVELMTVRELKPVIITPDISWQFLSHMDESGVLHRWKFPDYIDDDITPDLHSWEVFGDIAAANMPMRLHLVAIGHRQGNHQNSHWCRIYSHPKMPKVYQFNKKAGGELEGGWKPMWFSSSSSNSSKQWVDLMMRDNAVDKLIRHVYIKGVSEEHRQLFRRDVIEETKGMLEVYKTKTNPRDIPLSRYACDHPYTCPHQFFCYNTGLTLDSAGIYRRKDKENRNGPNTDGGIN